MKNNKTIKNSKVAPKTPAKKRMSPEVRARRIQQIFFTMVVIIIIASTILTLTMR